MNPTTDVAASGRLAVLAAPGGLCLVQDLLNSAAVAAFGVPDLLDDVVTADAWLQHALGTWAAQTGQAKPALSVVEDDLVRLRGDRDRVRRWLGGEDADLPPSTVAVAWRGRAMTYAPDGGGAEGFRGLVAAELLLGQRDGSVDRLRTCANPVCGAAFYDQSRNGSRVWHDVRTCGNVTNLRASRARRKAAAEDGGADPGV